MRAPGVPHLPFASRPHYNVRVPAFQLVLQFRGASVEDLDELLTVEDALFEMLGEGEELAGHDVGARARNIFIDTEDPDATFRRLTPFLERADLLNALTVAACPASEARYRMLWPPGQGAGFSLT
jgi:hypothetical protein